MKRSHNIIAIVIIAVAIAVAYVIIGGVPLPSWKGSAQKGSVAVAPSGYVMPTSSIIQPHSVVMLTGMEAAVNGPHTPHPPQGPVTYEIAQAATALPAFAQATIDPANVSVGQVQHFIIVTDDPNPVVSVVAEIQTDHGTTTVPLVSKGAPSLSMLVPRTVAVGATGSLALIAPTKEAPLVADAALGHNGTVNASSGNVALAATTNETEFTGQWTVHDTHTARYQTTFIAKDSAGNVNSVTLQWTDPCPFASVANYAGGTSTITATCEIYNTADRPALDLSPVDGPENGNLSITGGTLIIDDQATLVMNSGYSISLGGGSLALTSSPPSPAGQVILGQDMCGTDNDGDGYIGGSSWSYGAACSSMTSRKNLTGGLLDCNDNDLRAHPGQTTYQTSSELGSNTNSDPAWPWDFNCSQVIQTNPTQTSTMSCTATTVTSNGCPYVQCSGTITGSSAITSASCGKTVSTQGCKPGGALIGGGSCPEYYSSCVTTLLNETVSCL